MQTTFARMDYLPAASLETLQLRARLLAKAREFFASQGFLEVETPILSADVTVDRHLDPMSTILAKDPRKPDVGRTLWLQTSPEFGMKRLLAAGATAIYQITRAFRNAEVGPLHNPEFTIVEWYRVGDDMAGGIALLSNLAVSILGTAPAESISYAAAFERFLEINPHTASCAALADRATAGGLEVPKSLVKDRDGLLNLLLAECVEPHLGQAVPTILFDYPASQAALARIRDSDPPVAERFELYVRGIELANGYHELLDPDELRQRCAMANLARLDDGKPPLAATSRLFNAMEAGLPPATGVALGFDRLAMLAAGAKTISEVIAFPIDRA
jgi:elongation factor P--(R)-beta-lysine ligase